MKSLPKGMAYVLAAAGLAVAASHAAGQTVTYEGAVKSIIAERCLGCHGKGAPTLADFEKDKDGWKKKMKGPRIDNYDDLMILVNGSDAGALMRRLDDGKSAQDSKPGNMNVYLGKNDEERAQRLEVFKKWVGNWTLKRRKDLSDVELRKITAPR